MLTRRTFLKAIGAAVGTIIAPYSVLAKPRKLEKNEPKPPGAVCPLCGSEDIEIKNGEGCCHNNGCGAEWSVRVEWTVQKWPTEDERIFVPYFEIASNPTIHLNEIKSRRHYCYDQTRTGKEPPEWMRRSNGTFYP
jgi:hypothetical protein